MSEHETEKTTPYRETRYRRRRDWIGSNILESAGYIRKEVDTSKLIYANEEVSNYMINSGVKHIAKLIAPLSSYSIFVIDHQYIQGSEDIYSKVLSIAKKWSEYRIMNFYQFILENEELFKKFGISLSQFISLLSGGESKTRVVENVEKTALASGGLQVNIAEVSAKIEKKETQVLEHEVNRNMQTARFAITFAMESLKKPTILVLDSQEVELIGANNLLKATMANKNLVILIYQLNHTGSNSELINLLSSGRAKYFASGFPPTVVKSELISMCLNMSKELSPKIFDSRKGTKMGISSTIKLLGETEILSKITEEIAGQYYNPYIASHVLAQFVSRLYAKFARSPENILEAYRKYNPTMKKAFSYALLSESYKILNDIIAEVNDNYYHQYQKSNHND